MIVACGLRNTISMALINQLIDIFISLFFAFETLVFWLGIFNDPTHFNVPYELCLPSACLSFSIPSEQGIV